MSLVTEMADMLRNLQWDAEDRCPSCNAYINDGHETDCKLASLLDRAKPVAGYSFGVRLSVVADPRPPEVTVPQLADVAAALNLTVFAQVNGVEVFAVPGETRDAVLARWRAARRRAPIPPSGG